ncbi:Ig-like domain-containing protein [Enterococcus dongliensis]|uniref:Ig-like domain-containing protein n=1 Tax=Enterococcus dongliensis TaxID=2559925 RepID=UPI004067839F
MGATETLSATVAPDDATDKSVQFTSSDSTIATVTPVQGKVTGVKAGTATITATTTNGKTATCEITVTAPSEG